MTAQGHQETANLCTSLIFDLIKRAGTSSHTHDDDDGKLLIDVAAESLRAI